MKKEEVTMNGLQRRLLTKKDFMDIGPALLNVKIRRLRAEIGFQMVSSFRLLNKGRALGTRLKELKYLLNCLPENIQLFDACLQQLISNRAKSAQLASMKQKLAGLKLETTSEVARLQQELVENGTLNRDTFEEAKLNLPFYLNMWHLSLLKYLILRGCVHLSYFRDVDKALACFCKVEYMLEGYKDTMAAAHYYGFRVLEIRNMMLIAVCMQVKNEVYKSMGVLGQVLEKILRLLETVVKNEGGMRMTDSKYVHLNKLLIIVMYYLSKGAETGGHFFFCYIAAKIMFMNVEDVDEISGKDGFRTWAVDYYNNIRSKYTTYVEKEEELIEIICEDKGPEGQAKRDIAIRVNQIINGLSTGFDIHVTPIKPKKIRVAWSDRKFYKPEAQPLRHMDLFMVPIDAETNSPRLKNTALNESISKGTHHSDDEPKDLSITKATGRRLDDTDGATLRSNLKKSPRPDDRNRENVFRIHAEVVRQNSQKNVSFQVTPAKTQPKRAQSQGAISVADEDGASTTEVTKLFLRAMGKSPRNSNRGNKSEANLRKSNSLSFISDALKPRSRVRSNQKTLQAKESTKFGRMIDDGLISRIAESVVGEIQPFRQVQEELLAKSKSVEKQSHSCKFVKRLFRGLNQETNLKRYFLDPHTQKYHLRLDHDWVQAREEKHRKAVRQKLDDEQRLVTTLGSFTFNFPLQESVVQKFQRAVYGNRQKLKLGQTYLYWKNLDKDSSAKESMDIRSEHMRRRVLKKTQKELEEKTKENLAKNLENMNAKILYAEKQEAAFNRWKQVVKKPQKKPQNSKHDSFENAGKELGDSTKGLFMHLNASKFKIDDIFSVIKMQKKMKEKMDSKNALLN
jgi:hypothetical protein